MQDTLTEKEGRLVRLQAKPRRGSETFVSYDRKKYCGEDWVFYKKRAGERWGYRIRGRRTSLGWHKKSHSFIIGLQGE